MIRGREWQSTAKSREEAAAFMLNLWQSAVQRSRLESALARNHAERVQKFELRRTQLQQRVTLIEELRKGQTGPVHMLDQLSLSLPSMMWLTDLKQNPGGTDVIIEGKSTGLTTLSDFVANLEASGYFKKSTTSRISVFTPS